MSKTVISFNGQHPAINYPEFEKSVKEKLRCPDASVYILNQFPAVVSAESFIDLLIIIVIPDIRGNYFLMQKGDKTVYLNNLIIPVKIVTGYENAQLAIDEEGLTADGEALDFVNDVNGLKFGLTDYLAHKLHLPRNELYIHPLIYVKNQLFTGYADNLMIGLVLGFDALLNYIKKCSHRILSSYKKWSSPEIYLVLDAQIQNLVEQAGKDSVTGYLTRKKIDRITKGLMEERPVFEDVNNFLISIEGKAGTGKTSELLLLMIHNIENGLNTLYLTYNKLLVYDIARTVVSQLNSGLRQQDSKRGQHSVTTLHKFFYGLSKRLGVLHVMSADRILKLTKTVKTRTRLLYSFIKENIVKNSITVFDYASLLALKEHIQNDRQLETAEKQVGIDIVNHISRKKNYLTKDLRQAAIDFVDYKTRLLEKIAIDDMFLRDYYEVLKNTLMAINFPADYYSKFDIQDKFDLLMNELNLQDRHRELDENQQPVMVEKEFLSTLKRKVGGVRMSRTVYIDEGQDCHTSEREILFSMFGYRNVVVANGGREQLIRHAELCNWGVFKNKRLLVRPVNKVIKSKESTLTDPSVQSLFGSEEMLSQSAKDTPESDQIAFDMVIYKNSNRSYRIKKTLLEFCNYIAEQCGLSLGLTPLNSEDVGELIFDFRGSGKEEDLPAEFSALVRKGTLHGCTNYESLMILIDADSRIDRTGQDEHDAERRMEGTINEFDNIDDLLAVRKKEWEYKNILGTELMFWDGSTEEKNRLPVPSPNECRLLFYESCRGLEAWCVACFNIDNFFDQKFSDPLAEKFLLNEEKAKGIQSLHITNEQRRTMFAGTWILMALTRPMDTLYLSFKDMDAEFTQMAKRYIATRPKHIKILE